MIKCLLWDFGDTLCDELSLWKSGPEWMDVYHSFGEHDGLGTAWNLGRLDANQFAEQLAARMSLTPTQILEHLRHVELFEFFPRTYDYFRACHLPQAIVTVNPVLFREIALRLGLDDFVETIVISAEERTDHKGVLCEIALARMAGKIDNSEALLIDNKASNLEQWAARGGPGYLYRDDEAFARDIGVRGLLPPLGLEGDEPRGSA